MAQRGLYPRKGPHTMENREGADTGDPLAQRCFKVAAGVPMFPNRGYGVSGVGSKERVFLGSCHFHFETCLPSLPAVANAGELL